MEEILTGLISAGVKSIGGVTFQTSQLKDLLIQARQEAIENGREKALLCCKAAGAELGSILHIEEINPNYRENMRAGGMMMEQESPDVRAFNPHNITVSSMMMLIYSLK